MKNTTINTGLFFCKLWTILLFLQENKWVHTMELFAMNILLVLLMLDVQITLLKTPFMDRYLHNTMGFKVTDFSLINKGNIFF